MSLRTKAAIALILLVVAYPVVSATPGQFIGEVIARWLDDGRVMELQEDFAYVDPTGNRWLAPKGAKVDGASIPAAAWSLIGGPFEGKYRKASVVHDVACQLKDRPWQEAHRMFYDAMLTSGVNPVKALTMYGAVLVGGPKWSRRVAIENVPYSEAQSTAYEVATTQARFGETANTSVVLEPASAPVPPCTGCDDAAADPPPPPPAATASVEVLFEPQPSIGLTEQQLAALEQEIRDQDLSVEQIEQRYLVGASGR